MTAFQGPFLSRLAMILLLCAGTPTWSRGADSNATPGTMIPAGIGAVDQELVGWLTVVLAEVLPDSRSFTARVRTHPPANSAQTIALDLAWDEGLLALDMDPPNSLGGVIDSSRWGKLRLFLDAPGGGWLAFGGLKQWCPLPAGSFQGLHQSARERIEEVRWIEDGKSVYRGVEVVRYRMTRVFQELAGADRPPSPVPPAWIWRAPSQKNLVIKARLEASPTLVYELEMDQIQLGKPPASRLLKPANFQKVDSIQSILLNSFQFPAAP